MNGQLHGFYCAANERMRLEFILKKVRAELYIREELKEACVRQGMTQPESDALLEPWGAECGNRDVEA